MDPMLSTGSRGTLMSQSYTDHSAQRRLKSINAPIFSFHLKYVCTLPGRSI